MTFLRILLLPVFAFSALTASAKSVEAPIVDVTVYPDRAVVTREATVELAPGITELSIGNLSEFLNDESLQVAAESSGQIAILDVRSAVRFGQTDEPERLQPLLAKQKELQEKIDQVSIGLALLHQQRGFLEKIEGNVTGERKEGDLPTPQEWGDLMVFFRESLGDLLPRIHEADTELAELHKELEAVNRQIAQTQGGERTRTKEAVVRIEAVAPSTEAVLSISYVVMNAGWSPVYNVRVTSAEKRIQLDYEATVRQRTGEDWNHVNLTLSTARPALGGTPPELGQWIVDVLRPMPKAAPASSRMERQYALMESAPQQSMAADAVVESSLTAVNLRIPTKSSIPADNQPHRVGIAKTPLQGDFFYTAVPKVSPHAYLQARVVHAGAAPILPGRTSIFLDGNLVGHSNLPQVEPEEEFDLPLGVDEAIQVERKLLRRFVERRGILSKSTHTRFEFLTTITNRRSTPEQVTVQDHIPVSQDERVEVKPIELSGGVADPEEPGLYVWEKTIPAGAKLEIRLTFSVEHPEEVNVIGL